MIPQKSIQQHSHSQFSDSSLSHQESLIPKISPKKIRKVPADVNSPPFYLPVRTFNTRYMVISNLGNGSFGEVSLAKINLDLNNSSNFRNYQSTLLERNENFKDENYYNKKTGLVAIKTMTKRLLLLNDYTRVKEIRFILSIGYHKNLVQIYEMFIDSNDFKLHIVMECLDQNLYQLIKARKHNRFSQQTLKSILSQILNGIRHIHHQDYFHRDIKPENILVSPSNRYFSPEYLDSDLFNKADNFVVKIADYGLSRHVDNKRPYTSYVSTRWYRAPEILLRKSWYSKPVDIWAFGSVAAEATTFRPLFPGSNEFEQTWKVLEVLGTPVSRNSLDTYSPSYGYWDEAFYLCNQLGFTFPEKKCIDIALIIPNPELTPLCDVIRECLAWNPSSRANVDTICSMPYFKGTCVDTDHVAIGTVKKTTFSNLINRTETLMGIKPKSVPNLAKSDYSHLKTCNLPTFNNGVHLSNLNEKRSPSVLGGEIFDLQMVPNLTQESLQSTTDENYEVNSIGDWNRLQQIHDVSEYENDHLGSEDEVSGQNSYETKINGGSNPKQSKQNLTYSSLDSNGFLNMDHVITHDEGLVGWNKMELFPKDQNSHQDFLNKDEVKEVSELFSFSDDYGNQHDPVDGYDGYKTYVQPLFNTNATDTKSFAQHVDNELNQKGEFSGKLYSKYNLHRITKNSEDHSNSSSLVEFDENFDTF